MRGALVGFAAALVAAGLVLLYLVRRPDSTPTRTPQQATNPPGTAAEPHASIAPTPTPSDPPPAPHDDAMDSLVHSGAAAEPWATQGLALLDELARGAVATGDRGCYVAGCGITTTFASRAVYEARRHDVETSAAWSAWTGGKRWTEPRADGDAVTVTLLLFRPD